MRIFTFFLPLILLFSPIVFSAPGDTTWVQGTQAQMSWHEKYEQEVTFPDDGKTYRKILMVFTLGKYNCPSGDQYCHQWDYTVLNSVMTETDTIEIARFITPFATQGWSRFNGNWTKDYVFDVTDYAPILKGEAVSSVFYQGYSGGFTADVKYAFIEGTPERDVIEVKQLQSGGLQYGNPNNPINDHLLVHNLISPEDAKSAELKVLITGHGMDNTSNCCEFTSKSYQIFKDDEQIATQAVWKDDCGVNQLYPQGGTWVYDRANWCPGEKVNALYHKIPGITEGNQNYDLQMRFPNYTGSGEYGSYNISSAIVYYGEMNKVLDASLEAIISPTTEDDYFRDNPGNLLPEVLIRNTGATTITSIEFAYGVKDSVVQTYVWEGDLASLEESRVVLEESETIKAITEAGGQGEYEFFVEIVKVNGEVDEDVTNNTLTSTFKVAPVFPGDLIVEFKTGSLRYGAISDASWKITDSEGNIVFERNNNAVRTTYMDTVSIAEPGMYQLKIETKQCMGLKWWAGPNSVAGYKAGSFKLLSGQGSLIGMTDYPNTGQASGDFGCEYVQNFMVIEPGTLALTEEDLLDKAINIYPNPAQGQINIKINEYTKGTTITIFDAVGKQVKELAVKDTVTNVVTSDFETGVYTFLIDSKGVKVAKRVIIVE